MSTHANRVKMGVTSVASSGTGDITLNAASSGFRSFATAYGANATVDILITEGTAWEIARNCAYTHSGTTVSRGTLENSSTGSAVAFNTSGTGVVVSVIATADWGNSIEGFLGAWGALSGENSITGTATALISRLNVCSGTSASYTVTLPAVSGNAGKYIGFVMAAGLTKLVTLDGNSSETIDGATTRVMWAGETALLYCDGSTWTKVAGKSIPLACGLYRTGNQGSISGNTSTTITLDTLDLDNSNLMADTANNRIKILRNGTYVITSVVRFSVLTPVVSGYIYINDTTDFIHEFSTVVAAANSSPHAGTAAARVFAKDDTIKLRGYVSSSGTYTAIGGVGASYLIAQEIPSW